MAVLVDGPLRATGLLALTVLIAPDARAAPELVADLDAGPPALRALPRPVAAAGDGQLWLHTPDGWPRPQLWHVSRAGARRVHTVSEGVDALPSREDLGAEALLRLVGPRFGDPEFLVVSDGTVLGTHRLRAVGLSGIARHDGRLYILENSSGANTARARLSELDPRTRARRPLFEDEGARPAGGPWSVLGRLYFVTERREGKRLFEWTIAGAVPVVDIGTTVLSPERGARAPDGAWLFPANSFAEGLEPWRWDADGPRLAADLVPGRSPGLRPFPFLSTRTGVLLTGAPSLYVSDGAQTRALEGSEDLRILGVADDIAYGADDMGRIRPLTAPVGAPTHRFEGPFVWWRGAAWGLDLAAQAFVRVDPRTGASTVVQDGLLDHLPVPDERLAALYALGPSEDGVAFTGWTEDGTRFDAGAIPRARSGSSWPSRVLPFGADVALLDAPSGAPQIWRWSADAGAEVLEPNGPAEPDGLIAAAGGLLYNHGRQIRFRAPGEAGPRILIPDLDAFQRWLTPWGDRALIYALQDGLAWSVWESDGTPDGTQPLATPEGRLRSSDVVGDELHIVLEQPEHFETWRRAPDGDWRDRAVLPFASNPSFVTVVDEVRVGVWFTRSQERDSLLLAPIDGPAPADTRGRVDWAGDSSDLRTVVSGHRMLILGERGWATYDVHTGRTRFEPAAFEAPRPIALVDGAWLFSAETEEAGRELWRFDPEAGPSLLADLLPGPASGAPGRGAEIDGFVVFSAQHVDFGRETWVTDGTAEGTRLLFDLAPGDLDGIPPEADETAFEGGYFAVADHVYFAGWTPEHGVEPFRFPRADLGRPGPPGTNPTDPTNPTGPTDESGESGVDAPGLASDDGCGCRSTPSSDPAQAALLLLWGLAGGLRAVRRVRLGRARSRSAR